MFIGVVDTIKHAVFEGDEVRVQLSNTHDKTAATRQWVFAIQGNKLVAQHIVGRMQRNRHRHRAINHEAPDHGHHTRGGHRQATTRQTVTVVVQHDAQSRHQGRIVLEGSPMPIITTLLMMRSERPRRWRKECSANQIWQ